MRLEEQLNILVKAQEKLNILSSSVQGDPNKTCINNIKSLLEGINDIKIFDYFNSELQYINEYDFFYKFSGERIVLDNNNYREINKQIDNLRYKLKTNIDILKSIVVPASELTLCIKLIEYDSIKDIADDLIKLDKIFNQVITHEDLNGNYNFSNFDVGTSWLYITISSLIAFNFIASLVWSATVIRKKIIEVEISNELNKQMKLKTETLEDLQKANAVLINDFIEAEATNIMTEHNLGNIDNEYKIRLIHSIKELSELIMKGVEIKPAINSSEEAKNLFPNFGKLDLIEEKTKLLDNKP
jgi:hypothetical protein